MASGDSCLDELRFAWRRRQRQTKNTSRHLAPGVALQHRRPRRPSQAHAEPWFAVESIERTSQCGRIAGRTEQSVDSILDQVFQVTYSTGDDRQPGYHVFVHLQQPDI